MIQNAGESGTAPGAIQPLRERGGCWSPDEPIFFAERDRQRTKRFDPRSRAGSELWSPVQWRAWRSFQL